MIYASIGMAHTEDTHIQMKLRMYANPMNWNRKYMCIYSLVNNVS